MEAVSPHWWDARKKSSLLLRGWRRAQEIIERLVGDKRLPTDMLAEIVERTDGIPPVRGGNDKCGAGGGQ
jgi:hypothetical protein